ncbi:MAG: adenosylcobalamin-dependent ribonucleoside-diphosphate reductase [Nanobdellota archaeon]
MNKVSSPTVDPDDENLGLGPLSLDLLRKRYLNKVGDDVVETPLAMMNRVAKNIAQADRAYGGDVQKTYKTFLDHLRHLHFIPASPILMNAGNRLQFLFSDHALDVPDSIEDIFEVLKLSAFIQQHGGGLGFSFSSIRPKYDEVSGMKNVAFGPLSVMNIFDTSFNAILQGGRRNGANMAVLHISHPDILSFIKSKEDSSKFQNFNLSVALTSSFMSAVKKDGDFDLINPRDNSVVQTVPARQLFDAIVEQSWKTGDPGIIFIDTMNDSYPFSDRSVLCTGACGQYELESFEGVPYAHINLSRMVKSVSDTSFELDFDLLKQVVHDAVHFLDNAVDMHNYVDEFFETQSKRSRKIGLGVLGFADLLFLLKIPYGSKESIDLIRKVMLVIKKESHRASSKLASQRGVFPLFEKSSWSYPMRNASITSIAPTGSTSLLAGTSQSIEPVYALSFTTTTGEGDELTVLNSSFLKAVESLSIDHSSKIQLRFVDSLQNISWLDDSFKNIFKTAMDVSPEQHLSVMATFQEYVDNSISKTINLPNSATIEDISSIFLHAFDLGCKGVTVYRDGCRGDQAVVTKRQTRLSAFKPDDALLD